MFLRFCFVKRTFLIKIWIYMRFCGLSVKKFSNLGEELWILDTPVQKFNPYNWPKSNFQIIFNQIKNSEIRFSREALNFLGKFPNRIMTNLNIFHNFNFFQFVNQKLFQCSIASANKKFTEYQMHEQLQIESTLIHSLCCEWPKICLDNVKLFKFCNIFVVFFTK